MRKQQHWPYGVDDAHSQRRMLEWAWRNDVRYAPQGRCLHWLTQKRCEEDFVCNFNRPGWLDRLSGKHC